jgi:MraZ protein
MFGTYEKKLDEKGRMILPAKIRKYFSNIAFLSFGPDGSLELRTEIEFIKLKERLLSNNFLNKDLRMYSRILFGNTLEVAIDKVGRINIEESLLKKAAIKQEVIIIGTGNKVEI